MNMIECCPLCQGDEFLISESGEKFVCGKCGFQTLELSNVIPTILSANTVLTPYIHVSENTLH
ncbi:transcription initiation factor TFIIIB [Vibrio ziniensis]|uniref:Transcription initiation factor TFIIIB n=1 Tax=Vibrio ziniensis TaxID=2711221 RepID=A0A6G7CRD2_9VIBR|nr:transcription initiation factor TFIIIB [Vibrio ziniensis]QIH44558.1 transcription initiation factor TFIIIB [Vibrio ziniensis]